MSAEPTPLEPAVPHGAAPAPPAVRPAGGRRVRILAVAGGLLAVTAAALLLQRTAGGRGAAPAGTAVVERRDFVPTLRLHGVVEAARSHTANAPRLSGPGGGSMIITKLAAAGTIVKPGDLLVAFDAQGQAKNVLDKDSEYRERLEQIRKKQADAIAADARDERELKEAEHAVATAELDVRRNEILSRIDAEKNDQHLEEARARLAQARKVIALRRRSFAAELRILEIQRDRAQRAMQHAENNVKRMTIGSPIAGLVVLQSIWKGGGMGEVMEGDDVRPGMGLVQVVDTDSLQVRASVNQVDLQRLRPGQRVTIRLDAYPDVVLAGALRQLGAIAVPGSFSDRLRNVPAVFSVEGKEARLMPDLSAAVDVELARQPGALVVPRDAVEQDSGRSYLRVKSGSGFERRAVTVGSACDHEVVIQSGVEAGAVVLRQPAAAAARQAS